MFKIFIVEDDPIISSVCAQHIASWGMQVHCVSDFAEVLSEFTEFDPHLVIMDISLPFYNGYHWCAQIRKLSNVPIIFLSSASDNMNVVMAINMGADDFIAKPFDLEVFTAKIQALLRRTYDFSEAAQLIAHRGAVLNLSDASLTYNELRIELSKNEYRILQTLMEGKGKIISRETLMRKLWETDNFVDENTLNVNIGRLRKKLTGAGLDGFITTKKGLGYLVE